MTKRIHFCYAGLDYFLDYSCFAWLLLIHSTHHHEGFYYKTERAVEKAAEVYLFSVCVMSVCLCTDLCVHVYMCAQIGQTSILCVFLNSYLPNYWPWHLTEPGAPGSARLVGYQAPEICLPCMSLFSPDYLRHTKVSDEHCAWLYMSIGIWIQTLMLTWWTLSTEISQFPEAKGYWPANSIIPWFYDIIFYISEQESILSK